MNDNNKNDSNSYLQRINNKCNNFIQKVVQGI